MLPTITPHELQRRLAEGSAVLIDVREAAEYAREHIVGARLVPVSGFDAHDFDRDHDKAVVFHCQSGNRTAQLAARIIARGFPEAYALAGGLEAWRRAGLPVHEDRSQPLPLMRQVQIAAGSLVLLGVVLGFLLGPAWFALAGGVGEGLVFAGVSGFCGMATLLARMPWNRVQLPPGGPASAHPAG